MKVETKPYRPVRLDWQSMPEELEYDFFPKFDAAEDDEDEPIKACLLDPNVKRAIEKADVRRANELLSQVSLRSTSKRNRAIKANNVL